VKASERQAQSERIPTKSPGHSEMMSEDPRVIEPRSGPADLLLQGCWLPDGRGPREEFQHHTSDFCQVLLKCIMRIIGQ
jgi:hypothetical protein